MRQPVFRRLSFSRDLSCAAAVRIPPSPSFSSPSPTTSPTAYPRYRSVPCAASSPRDTISPSSLLIQCKRCSFTHIPRLRERPMVRDTINRQSKRSDYCLVLQRGVFLCMQLGDRIEVEWLLVFFFLCIVGETPSKPGGCCLLRGDVFFHPLSLSLHALGSHT